jgi:hypothetical protein
MSGFIGMSRLGSLVFLATRRHGKSIIGTDMDILYGATEGQEMIVVVDSTDVSVRDDRRFMALDMRDVVNKVLIEPVMKTLEVPEFPREYRESRTKDWLDREAPKHRRRKKRRS